MKAAVLHRRVSTVSQVQTDYDPEGISIPAQRVACQRMASRWVSPSWRIRRAGPECDDHHQRWVFQEMLARIKAERDVDYVIVYNLSRLNRNRVDDAQVLMLMGSLKVTLICPGEHRRNARGTTDARHLGRV